MENTMEQTSGPQTHIADLQSGSSTPVALSSGYWDNLDALYMGSDQHQNQHPQSQSQQQQPLGISWDHPVFHQRNQQQSPQDQDHGIYGQSPQSWHQNPLQQSLMSSTQDIGVSPQYDQINQYTQDPVVYEPSYAFSQDYYPALSQQLPMPDTFSKRTSPQSIQPRTPQSAVYQPAAHQAPITQYAIPTGYSQELTHTPITFHNTYQQPPASLTDQQTINPQFLNAPQQPPSGQQRQSMQNNFLYLSPADFERNNGVKTFSHQYREGLQSPAVSQITAGQRFNLADGVTMVVDNQGFPTSTKHMIATRPRKKGSTKTTRKDLNQTSGRESASVSSGSESSGDSDLEVVPEEPSPIPPTRPSEPTGAAQYDTLKAVWSSRTRRPGIGKIKSALVSFKDVVKTVRDVWKEKSQAMKMAENKGENDKAAELKKDVVLQRSLMNVVVNTTLEKGHPAIVAKLGEHPMSVTAMYSFLLDRHHASDFDGALTMNILKLLARFDTMDEDTLNKTNIGKLLPRFMKKGGQTVRDLAQKVLENAAASTKRKQETTTAKPASNEGSPVRNPAPNEAVANGARTEFAGSKRPREGETNGFPATKRVIVASNPKNGAKSGSSGNGAPAKRSQETTHDTKTAASRPRANIVAPKPTNLFGTLSSASKRPGTSNAERAAAAAATKVNTSTGEKKENVSAAPKQPTFSFGDLMADLNKPKDVPVAKPTEDRPPETEEERAKRLRKEERRKLRVSWKPESSLTEVRLFTHDPDEELGPGDSSHHEVGDVKGEGRVLKLHREFDEEDEEDDGGACVDEPFAYHEPLETDFSEVTEEDRFRNFIKRAGTQQPDSPEMLAQEHRETTTLMVFYTSAADIPPSPKEPPPPSPTEQVPEEVPFGEPPDYIKARQERYYSVASYKPTAPSQPSAPNGQEISSLLRILQNAPQRQQQQQQQQQQQAFTTSQPQLQPQPLQQQAAPMSDLERTISMFRQQQVPAQLPQLPQVPVTQQPPTMQNIDFQQILAIVNAQKQMQQLAQPQQTPPQPPAIAPNLAAVISQLTSQNQHAAAPGPEHRQWQNSFYEDVDRKRMRESRGGYDGASEDRDRYVKRSKNSGEPKPKRIGVVPCKYWRKGHCGKGDECTYRHDPLD